MPRRLGSWWHDHGLAIEMPALEDVAPYLGYTMIAIPNAGKVMEVDKAGNIRWQITGLASPFHAQMLRGIAS